MLFSSTIFLFFFLPLLLGLYFILPGTRSRNLLLLVASLFFYAWGAPKFVIFLMASSTLDYLISQRMSAAPSKSQSRRWLILAISMNLIVFFYFKYMNFFSSTIGDVTGIETPAFTVWLPLGISFFTFQQIAWLVDVYRTEVQEALISITGRNFGFDRNAWMEWWQEQNE